MISVSVSMLFVKQNRLNTEKDRLKTKSPII